ncbi:MAG TPA: type II toxin-antitoxin system death-on-curing family toxin [Longimicrobiales bacterium]|nr:type II toxin-antitoxin system death-on-curing family toxin [Longimicrobiales bacterium]
MPEPIWLTRAIVEALHAVQVREHGGQLGLRDEGLLESALARPRNVWSYQPDADLTLLAAEYGYGLAKNHAFLDGNKRIAFVAMNVLLILNGYEIDAPEPEVVERMLEVADGRLPLEGLGEWIRPALTPVQDV